MTYDPTPIVSVVRLIDAVRGWEVGVEGGWDGDGRRGKQER